MYSKKQNQIFFNKIILAHCEMWINNQKNDIETIIPDICHKIKYAGFTQRAVHPFNKTQILILKEISNDSKFKSIKEEPISHITMALEIMKLWINDVPKKERPHINISDRKLTMGKHHYLTYLLKIKSYDQKLYDDQKKIIEETAIHAIVWYNWMKKRILNV